MNDDFKKLLNKRRRGYDSSDITFFVLLIALGSCSFIGWTVIRLLQILEGM